MKKIIKKEGKELFFNEYVFSKKTQFIESSRDIFVKNGLFKDGDIVYFEEENYNSVLNISTIYEIEYTYNTHDLLTGKLTLTDKRVNKK